MSEQEPARAKVIPLAEIRRHNSLGDLWVAINGKVYDITKFVDQHPGGDEVLLDVAGTDATQAFEDIGHSEYAVERLEEYYLGEGDADVLKAQTRKSKASIEDSAAVGGGLGKKFFFAGLLFAIIGFLYIRATY